MAPSEKSTLRLDLLLRACCCGFCCPSQELRGAALTQVLEWKEKVQDCICFDEDQKSQQVRHAVSMSLEFRISHADIKIWMFWHIRQVLPYGEDCLWQALLSITPCISHLTLHANWDPANRVQSEQALPRGPEDKGFSAKTCWEARCPISTNVKPRSWKCSVVPW